MSDTGEILLPYGGYEKLRAYKVAEVVYDATVVFCNRFIDKRSRTHDQMVQAARSGVRNISEGSGAAATSKKTELKLTNVARASLNDELLKDYRSFLIQRGLRVWPKTSLEALAMRDRLKHDIAPDLPRTKPGIVRLTGLAGLADFVGKASAELAANAMLCATHQAAYLLRRLIEQQAKDFAKTGGFTEHLYATRMAARSQQAGDAAETPACPQCGKPMQNRQAKTGPHTGKAFWGCTGYPNCRAILPILEPPRDLGQPDKSDRSDGSDRSQNPGGAP